MPRSGPRQIYKYSKEFKLAAVRLSHVPGMQVKAVATALGIHPFMLSKWRKDVRDGTVRGRLPRAAPAGPAREIAQLQALEKRHALLQEEHDLLKKAIRFCASRRRTPSRSSTSSAPRTASRGSADASA
jgi:transposase